MRYRILLTALCFLLWSPVWAQDTAQFAFSGYAELYYGYDFSRPGNGERPFFIYNHKRHHEVALNIAMVKAAYTSGRLRANGALMVGNYPQYNLAAEPVALRFIYEANVGFRLSQAHNLWVDAGIMPSHIGFESAIGADHWTASRSMAADNSPYYETGVRVSVSNKEGNFYGALLYLNGWQHMQRPEGVSKPAFGGQINYKPSPGVTLNYSNFIGSDKPDSLHAWRVYHNFYAILENNRWGLITGFDLGRDRGIKGRYAWWYTPVVVVRRTLGKQSRVAARAEYYRDRDAAILTGNPGFGTWGYSVNIDRNLAKGLLLRLEGRQLRSREALFAAGTSRSNFHLLATMSLVL